MQVLGTVNHPITSSEFTSSKIAEFTISESKFPQIYCPLKSGISVQVILFDRPLPGKMQYMSLTPMALELGDPQKRGLEPGMQIGRLGLDEENERLRINKLVEKLKLHTIIRYTSSSKEKALPMIINQINCSYELHELLQRNIAFIGPRRKRSMSVSELMVESATTAWTFVLYFLKDVGATYVYPVLSQAFLIGLIVHRIAAEAILTVLEWRPPSNSAMDNPERRPALKDVSATCQQIDIRLQQFCYWPIQYAMLQHRKANWSSIPTSHADYIRFYNSLWLVANDVIIGIALGSYIIDNANIAAVQISHLLNVYTISGLQRMITWLMGWPAGLKLNNELAAFLGDLFLWVIDYWASTIKGVVTPLLPRIIYFIGFASFAGASLPIALLSDLLSLLTLHIYSFYIASARIFNWQLTIIASLFHLFRGKKRNVLRNRIDSCDYDLDQLLLGTILFTLLFFLLPTVIVFYLTFASARMTIIVFKAVLDTLLACLNHFPLFALMLRFKDAGRLPGGVHFSLHTSAQTWTPHDAISSHSSTSEASTVAYITLSSAPLSLRAIFSQYFQLGHRIRKHYLSPSVVLCLVTGRFVPPIHRKEMYSLQYSMLPAHRASVAEVWRRLVEGGDGEMDGHVQRGGKRKKGKRWKN